MAPRSHMATVAPNGRLVVPLEVRRAAGLEGGGRVIARAEDGRIILETVDAAVARVQDVARRYIRSDDSMADELVAERRAEAERE